MLEGAWLLLDGLAAAWARDGGAPSWSDGDGARVYDGLLTVVLRLTVVALLERRVPEIFENMSHETCFSEQSSRRWSRQLARWAALHRRLGGALFDPERHAWIAAARIDDVSLEAARACVLASLPGAAVESLGGVYERASGHEVWRAPSRSVCLGRAQRWIPLTELRARSVEERKLWLREQGFTRVEVERVERAVASARDARELQRALASMRAPGTDVIDAGHLVIQPCRARADAGTHYTPRALAESTVRRALAPLLAALGEAPRSEQLLRLKICDPAMGCGAFLLATCRVLAEHVRAAWQREGRVDTEASARFEVARRCLHGVDTDPVAVELAQISLWLSARASGQRFTAFDHALRRGDALIGVDLEQLQTLSWTRTALHEPALARAIKDADVETRRALADLLLAPQLVPACAVGESGGAAQTPARRLRALQTEVAVWLTGDTRARDVTSMPPRLATLRRALRRRVRPFHWPLEFPDALARPRASPLAPDERTTGFDAIIGNPPFMGQARQRAALGAAYRAWLCRQHPGCGGKADLAVHFLRRADDLLASTGTISQVITNTVSQGDSREGGLGWMLARGAQIYDATGSATWPGRASVSVSVVHLARGRVAARLRCRLNGAPVPAINSWLRPQPERETPARLRSNAKVSFLGCKLGGQGFALTNAERQELVARDPKNAARIFPYIGGEEINSSPRQRPHRHVIDFAQMSLQDARGWPDLLARVEARVRPYRLSVRRKTWRRRWWQFAEVYPAMRAAVAALPRCLVTARVTKHLCFSFQPPDRVFSEALTVIALAGDAHFAVLQSRVHRYWAWLLGSSMRRDLRYSATDCFETFAFPEPEHLSAAGPLSAVGATLHETRARLMSTRGQGLTALYNQLKRRDARDAELDDLRELHRELDRVTLRAYGWDDLSVPEYTTPEGQVQTRARQRFEQAILERLFSLNQARREPDQAPSEAV